MATTTQDEIDNAIAAGLIFRAEFGKTIALASTGTYFLGLVVGDVPLKVLGRSYSSSESPLTIELIEATFTLGSNARTVNRNMASLNTPPAQFVSDVTPGALGAVITGITLRAATSGGSSAVSVAGDTNALVTKRNTSYVVRFTNGGGANAVVAGAIDYRALA